MPKRPGKAALQRRQDAHRNRVNALNSDRFDKISAYVTETGDIDIIRTYTKLLTTGNFDEIDRIIASFSNESLVLSVDIVDNDQFINISDTTPIDIAYKNKGRAQILDETPTLTEDEYAEDPSNCEVHIQEHEVYQDHSSSHCVAEDEILDIQDLEHKAPHEQSPVGSPIKNLSTEDSKVEDYADGVPSVKRIETNGCTQDESQCYSFSDACSEIVIYTPEAERVYKWFLEDHNIVAPYNTTFLESTGVKRVKHGILLTDNVKFFNENRGICIAIVPKYFVLPNLKACFLLRTDKEYGNIFHLRMRWERRFLKFDPRRAVDLSSRIDVPAEWKRRRLK